MSEHISTKQQAYALHLQIDQFLDSHPGGGANPDSLREIESLGRHLKWTSSHFDEKVDSLLNWADILYSSRKHARWNTRLISGVDQVRGFIRQDLASLKFIIGWPGEADRHQN